MDVDEAADNDGKGEGSSGSTSSRPPKLTAGRSAVRRKVVICRSEHADGPFSRCLVHDVVVAAFGLPG